MIKNTYILFSLFLILSLNIYSQTRLNEAINFTLESTEGETVNLFDELDNGKTIMLSFFSTDCGNCVLEAPKFDSIYRQFGSGTEQLLVWGIASPFDGITDIEEFISNTEITYPCFPTGHGDDVFALYEVSYTPQIYIVCDYTVSESIPFDAMIEYLNYCFPTKINTIKVYTDIYSYNQNLYIKNSENNNAYLKIYDITGKTIKSINLNSGSEITISDLQTNSIYIVSIIYTNGKSLSQKVLVK